MAIVLIAVLLGVVTLPQFWVRYVMDRHSTDRPDLDGSGGELARHLLDRFGLEQVKVETTDSGDHYDPKKKAVRLTAKHHDGRSLAAVAVAAHEVGHALQDAGSERMLALRQRLAAIAATTDRIAGVFFIAAPVLAVVIRAPLAFFALLGIGVALLAVRVVTSVVTLPVEFDASFSKALPILKSGRYVDDDDMPALKGLLRAAALTYVAGALISLVNLVRWIRLLF